jgi:1,2-diacylglycerol 3-alpha-glucosyltransferase
MMKIVHLCLSGPYNDNWGYQDNLLPLYQQKLGHDVTVIATNTMHGPKGPIIECNEGDYRLENGLHIVRIAVETLLTEKIGRAYSYFHVYDLLKSLKPDHIMVHGLVSITALQAIKYKMKVNPNCVLVADTHQDHNNSPPKKTLKNKLYFLSLFLLNKICIKHYKHIFGVAPACIDYANEMYKIPRKKMSLLPLGCDTDDIKWGNQGEIRAAICQKYELSGDDFIIVTGGKLDSVKNTHSLIQAVGQITNNKIKLLVFGSIADEYRQQLSELFDKYNERVIYTGFLSLNEIYNLYLAADLAVFPGSQSALWQQAIASGLPTVFKKWPNISYLDVGGNCIFLEKADSQEIKNVIESLINNEDVINKMKEAAKTKGYKRFSYREITKQSLQ